MRIKNLEIKNFRNYPSLSIEINSNTVVLTGPNAVGKTNLLESVYFASLFKSFRDDTEFIFLKDSTNLELKMLVEKDGEDHELCVYLEKRDKIYANFLIDGVKKKRREAQGFVSVVIFDPTDVDMFTKTPEVRRKYLNMVLSQKTPEYLDALANYKKVLYQKNRLLQAIKSGQSQGEDLPSLERTAGGVRELYCQRAKKICKLPKYRDCRCLYHHFRFPSTYRSCVRKPPWKFVRGDCCKFSHPAGS